MDSKTKVNHVNFSYLFSVSILSLFAIFLTMMVPNAKDLLTGKKTPQQFEATGTSYKLIQHPNSNVFTLALTPSNAAAQVIDMELQDQNGNTVTNQTNIRYEWLQADNTIVSVAMQAWNSEAICPFGIIKPCPGIRGEIRGLKPGSTTVTVKAILTEQTPDPNSGPSTEKQTEIAAATFNVKVISEIPAQALINYKVKLKGVNKKPPNVNNQKITIRMIIPNLSVPLGSYENVDNLAVSNSDGTFSGYFYLDRGYLGKSNYRFCIKGSKHLQKCFNNISILYDDNQFLDFSSTLLEPGDLSLPQNSGVDNNDLTYLWEHRGSRDGSILGVGDLNYDGVINMGDMNLLLQNFGKTDDQL